MACKPENVSLPLFCAYCDGAVELQYEPTTNRDTLLDATYECPYCRETNPLTIPGRVLWVTERDAKEDATRRPKIR